MSKGYRIAVLLIVALAAFAALRWGRGDTAKPASELIAEASKEIPRLVDLGSKQCIPCKKMAPILDELEREFQGRFEVVFIDVRENQQAAQDYGIRLIPTQVFFDGTGKELFRHEGFYGRDDILAKWRELGVNIGEQKAGSNGTNL